MVLLSLNSDQLESRRSSFEMCSLILSTIVICHGGRVCVLWVVHVCGVVLVVFVCVCVCVLMK
jgi:hypothetical protein